MHWNGQTWRFHPRDFTMRTSTIDRYGASTIPAGMTIQDWGITYDELEPYYDKFEYMAGIAGKAGNLKGKQIPGGNVFEGAALARVPGSSRRPTPRSGPCSARQPPKLGYHPFYAPTANLPKAYKNPDGIQRGPAPTAGSASGSAARWAPRPTPRPP